MAFANMIVESEAEEQRNSLLAGPLFADCSRGPMDMFGVRSETSSSASTSSEANIDATAAPERTARPIRAESGDLRFRPSADLPCLEQDEDASEELGFDETEKLNYELYREMDRHARKHTKNARTWRQKIDSTRQRCHMRIMRILHK